MEHAQTSRGRDFRNYSGKMNSDDFTLAIIDNINDYKDFIFEHISFVDVLRELKLNPQECNTGKYTHKMICPFKFHKLGRERTGSFRINEQKKTFTCYGCNEFGNILKFLQFFVGGSENYHLELLARKAGILKNGTLDLPTDYVITEQQPIKETNHRVLFDIGLLLREYLIAIKSTNNYHKECEWVDRVFIKIDKLFNDLDEYNLEDAQKIYDKINNTIKRRGA